MKIELKVQIRPKRSLSGTLVQVHKKTADRQDRNSHSRIPFWQYISCRDTVLKQLQ